MINIVVNSTKINIDWVFGICSSCDINILVYDKGEFKRKINIPAKVDQEEEPECFYKTLGILKPQDNDMDANKKIKYAFHRKALETHPDKGGDPADFMKVLNAYEALYDDEKRNIYNKCGYRGLKKFEREQKVHVPQPYINPGLAELNKMKGENKECEDDEARAYLKYIINHYDNLPYYTFFIHSEMYSPYHTGSILDKFNEAVLTKKLFYNINDKKKLQSIVSNPLYDEILEWYDKYIEKYIPINNLPSKDWTVNYKGSAQFLVHKLSIQNLPKQFYEELYEWIMTTDMPPKKSNMFLELTWHIFWDICPNL